MRAADYLEGDLTALVVAMVRLFGPDSNAAFQLLKPLIEKRIAELARSLRDSVLVAVEPESSPPI